MVWFDESRLDDATALGAADLRLRTLAESGALRDNLDLKQRPV